MRFPASYTGRMQPRLPKPTMTLHRTSVVSGMSFYISPSSLILDNDDTIATIYSVWINCRTADEAESENADSHARYRIDRNGGSVTQEFRDRDGTPEGFRASPGEAPARCSHETLDFRGRRFLLAIGTRLQYQIHDHPLSDDRSDVPSAAAPLEIADVDLRAARPRQLGGVQMIEGGEGHEFSPT